jgi:mRNA interferase RelE/StbE
MGRSQAQIGNVAVTRWNIIFSKDAEKCLLALPRDQRFRIENAIDMLTAGPYNSRLDVKPLKGRPEWRLRVGRWRVVFRVNEGKVIITVVSVKPRGGAYK